MSTAETQGALWSGAAHDWADMMERLQTPYYDAAFDAVGVCPGMSLLDAGCGSGLALALAHARGAAVTGLDAADGLLAVARARASAATLVHGDLEALPFDSASFDAVTAFNAVQFAGDPVQALREIRRVAKPGAAVAITTWGPPAECDMSRVLGALAALAPAPPGAAGPFALSAPGTLAALVESAGLEPGQTIDVPTPFAFPGIEAAVRGQMSPGPARRAIALAGEQAVRETLVAALAPFVLADGSLRLENVMRVLIARA